MIERVKVIVARYESACAVCGCMIEPDHDEIGAYEATDEWAHAACLEEEGIETYR